MPLQLHSSQGTCSGFYQLEVTLVSAVNHGGAIDVWGTCMDAQRIAAGDFIPCAHRDTLYELVQWNAWADEALVF